MTTVSSSTSATQSTNYLQITGLASGLDTNAIISAMLSIEQQPITNLTNEQTGLNALTQQLTSIQSALQGVSLDASALSSPGLFANVQTVTSTNSALVGAAATGSSGAVVGGYQVAVSSLATSAQRTFTFASPASAASFTVDGQTVSLAAGASASDLANAINSSSSYDVWAAATDSGTIVLSDRQTGTQAPGYIAVADSTGTLSEQTSLAQAGQNAAYTVNGVSGSSASNTLTNAIPGVTLTLNGVTGSNPATVNVGAPAPSTSAITSAVNTFVSAYNAVIDQIQGQLSQAPVSGDPTKGGLFGDEDLTDLLSRMRESMYTPGTGLPSGMAALSDIGITTGAGTGGASSQASLSGHLTVDTTALANAIQSNPQGVENVLQSWSSSFSSMVDAEAQTGGSIDARISGDNTLVSSLSDQIASMNEMLANRKAALTQQFATLEGTLSNSQSTSSWLSSQINALPLA